MTTWNAGIITAEPKSIAPSLFTITLAGALAALTVSASAATVASPTVRTPAYTSPKLFGRTVTVTTSASVGSYNTSSPIVITGTNVTGATISESVSLTASGGGESITTVHAFVTVTEIDIPAQLNTSGTIAFATKDIQLPRPCREVRVGTAGSGALHVGYDGGDGTILQDTIVNAQTGERFPLNVRWLYIDSSVQNITLLW